MANKTMHHVVIGSDTYEIVDEQGRAKAATNTQDITALKEDLNESVGELKNALYNIVGYVKEKTLSAINGAGKWVQQASGYSYIINVNPGDIVAVTGNATAAGLYTVLKSLENINVSWGTPDYATGYNTYATIGVNAGLSITIPSDGHYIWFYGDEPGYTNDLYYPSSVKINGVSIDNTIPSLAEYINEQQITKQVGIKYYASSETLDNGKHIQYSDGAEIANEYYSATGFIQVTGVKIGVSRGIGQFAFYDKDKAYVSGALIVSSMHEYAEYSIPSNAKYVRLSVDVSGTYTTSKVFYLFSDGIHFPFADYCIVNPTETNIPEFTKLRPAVEYGVQYPNAKIYVICATYNLLSEFATEISASTTTQYGLGVGNGIHIFCESGTKINCLYTGSDINVNDNLSPFYSLHVNGGFTLENVEIHSSECRYCVHDEYSGSDVIVRNIYKNCKMYHDYTGSTGRVGWYPQCIGGGCAKHSYVDIEGCYFYSASAEAATTPLVSYHNSSASNSDNNVNVSNSYFDGKGTFECSYYGTTELVSKAVVSNCSLGAEPYTRSQAGTHPENFSLLKFNNTVRP